MWRAVEWVRDTAYDLWHLLHPVKNQMEKVNYQWKKPMEGWYKCNVDGAFLAMDKLGQQGWFCVITMVASWQVVQPGMRTAVTL